MGGGKREEGRVGRGTREAGEEERKQAFVRDGGEVRERRKRTGLGLRVLGLGFRWERERSARV